MVDVTLGSLLNESLEKLESLRLYGDLDEESESGLVRDDEEKVDDQTHSPVNEANVGGMDGPPAATAPSSMQRRPVVRHQMHGRGMPYFEEMVENSRLGRIKRQKGGHTSADGTRSVEWEVVEIGGEDEPMADTGGVTTTGDRNKRQRLDG